MTKQIQDNDGSNNKPLALIFLVTFGVLTLVSAWLIYGQFAQVFTRTGQCTVLSAQTHKEAVNTDDPTDEAAQYNVTFVLSLLTPEGQRLRVPGYYSSSNYTVSDQNSAQALLQRYPVGSTTACGYTYLDPSGIKALFSPAVPLEGFLVPGFFLLLSLVISVICIVALRKGPVQDVLLPDPVSATPGSAS